MKLNKTMLVNYEHQWLKAEYQQPSGAHKDRETKWIMDNYRTYKEFCITTSGNAGISLAYGFHCNATIFCPSTTHQEKIDLMKMYGGNVIVAGNTYKEAFEWCEKYVTVRPFDRLNVSTGKVPKWMAYKALAKELQTFKFKNVFVPSGTLTLAGGLAKFFKGTVYACTVSLHATKEQRDMLSSIAVNFQDEKLINSVKNLIVVNVPADDLDRVLSYRTDVFYRKLDPCVLLPIYMERVVAKKNSVIIATGVAR